MSTAAEKLHILILQHCEHVSVDESVITAMKGALEKNAGKAKGSTLYDLFCNATGEGLPPQQQQQQAQQPQGRASMQMQQAPATRMSAQMSSPPVVPPSAKPVIAKEPEQRNLKLDQQLMQAAKGGSPDTIPGLITQGAYVNMQDSTGTTPLLAATEADKADVCRVLLQNGADVNLARNDGTSPLLCAYKGNKKKVLKELTAGAFRTLNSAVHQTGFIGSGCMYDPSGEDEGVTHMDICQAREETEKLFHLQAHAPEIKPQIKLKHKESLVSVGGFVDPSNLRQGGVRLLMQELCQATQKIA